MIREPPNINVNLFIYNLDNSPLSFSLLFLPLFKLFLHPISSLLLLILLFYFCFFLKLFSFLFSQNNTIIQNHGTWWEQFNVIITTTENARTRKGRGRGRGKGGWIVPHVIARERATMQFGIATSSIVQFGVATSSIGISCNFNNWGNYRCWNSQTFLPKTR